MIDNAAMPPKSTDVHILIANEEDLRIVPVAAVPGDASQPAAASSIYIQIEDDDVEVTVKAMLARTHCID